MRRSQRTTPRFPQSAVELIWFVCVYVTCPFFLRLDLFVFVCVFGSVVFNSLQRASAHLPYHLPHFSLSALPGLCDNSEKRKACPCERHIYVFDLRTVASICVCDRFLQTVCICICAKKLYYISVCFDRLSRLHSCTSRPPHHHPRPPRPPKPHTLTHTGSRDEWRFEATSWCLLSIWFSVTCGSVGGCMICNLVVFTSNPFFAANNKTESQVRPMLGPNGMARPWSRPPVQAVIALMPCKGLS